MDQPDIDIEAIAHLIGLVETRGLAKLVVEADGRRVTIRGRAQVRATVPAPTLASASPRGEAPHGASDRGAPSPDWTVVKAPMVGVFYRAPRPDEPAFVEEGDYVEAGQAIGMIEAMKVFSEIPSEHAGVVERIVAQNGELVRPDDPLMYLSDAVHPDM